MKINRIILSLVMFALLATACIPVYAEAAGRDPSASQSSGQQVFDGIQVVTKPAANLDPPVLGIVLWALIIVGGVLSLGFLGLNSLRYQKEKRLQLINAKPKLIITQGAGKFKGSRERHFK